MKNTIKILCVALLLLNTSCGDAPNNETTSEQPKKHQNEIHLSAQQFVSLQMKVDTLPKRNLTSYVEANGRLEVPPQNEAIVTAVIGANVVNIKVIEGEKVKYGQALALVSHPDLIKLQTNYLEHWNQFQYLEKAFIRQKKLYKEKVGSGKEFQKIEAEFLGLKGRVKGDEAQLKLLGLNVTRIQAGNLFERIAIASPIEGYVRKVAVKTGQYVQPQTEMFEIVNIDHIHADLMVFEKDIYKVKKGQKVNFNVASLGGKELKAEIYAVGKAFEQDPKAIHLHAEIQNKEGMLIPGMYVRGRIIVDDVRTLVLPEDGIVKEGEKYFMFEVKTNNPRPKNGWVFKPVEIVVGEKDDGWIEVKLLNTIPGTTRFAWNNAYYLMAEMKKSEAGHMH